MHNSPKKSKKKSRSKMVLSLTMAMIMVFSSVINVFADVAWPGTKNYVTGVSFNGGHSVAKNNPDGSPAPLDTSSMPSDYQNVPVDATFTLTTNMGKVFLFRGSYDPNTGTFSDKVLNRDLVQIQDSNGNPVSDVMVSNQNDPDKTSVMDQTVQVHPNKPLAYDTNYKLVLKKYFDKSNQKNPPTIQGVVMDDVVIPFKTQELQKPTVTKAELRGSTLTLEGLTKNKKLEYNLAVDGNFNDTDWKAFDYADDTANINVSGVNLTLNSKVKVGYVKDDNSTPTDISDPISVLYASVSGPSFTGAVLNGNNLVLNGLPKSAVNLEYSIAADGQNYSTWRDLSVTGTSAAVDASGLNLIEGKSIIQVRYKASAPWPASDVTQGSFIYGLGTTAHLEQGKDTVIDQGVKISPVSLNTPGAGESNTVTVRNSKGEMLPIPGSVGFFGEVDTVLMQAGGVYGFNLKGAGSGDNNHVKITIPFKLPAEHPNTSFSDSDVMDSSKVGIFMLVPVTSNAVKPCQTWIYMPTTIDNTKGTATVDVSNFDANGKDVILAVKYDRLPPTNCTINPYAKTDKSITIRLMSSDESNIKKFVMERENVDDPTDKKTITLEVKDYKNNDHAEGGATVYYVDTDVRPGVNYKYTAVSITDMLNNEWESGAATYTTLDSVDMLVKETQDSIYASLKKPQPEEKPRIIFGTGDSQNSVSQEILLPTGGILYFGNNSITWTSSRPDILKIGRTGAYTEVHPPLDANGNPIKDGVAVTLTGIINYTGCFTNQNEKATGTVTIPVTVKWNMANGQVTIGNEFLKENIANNYDINTDPTTDINAAAKFDDSIANTIVFNHSIRLRDKTVFDAGAYGAAPQNYVIDAHGKTIKANFNGALFDELQCQPGSFTLKNAVIDMNHKAGPVLYAQYLGNKITFDNVKIINAENCQYGIMLNPTMSSSQLGSFTANNSHFTGFKVAAIAAVSPAYKYTTTTAGYTSTFESLPIPVEINNCNFNGEGNSGYGVLDAYGNVTIKDSTFNGYKGNVNTGWNSSNDVSNPNNEATSSWDTSSDGDGNKYFQYKGIPDGSPSSAVLVKELGSVNLSGNTITNSDNSVLTWTGEKNFSFLWRKPVTGFTAYPTVNGIKVDSTTVAAQAVDSVLSSNTIAGTKDSSINQAVVQDAADRYNRTTLLAKTGTPDTTAPTWDSTSKVEASKVTESSLTLNWSGASDNLGVTSYNIYKDGTLIGSVDGNATSYNVTGLNPSTEYTFKVEAVDGGNNTAAGPSTKVKTVDTTAPTWSVTNTAKTSNVTENSATVSWDKAKDNVGVTAYRIYKNDVLAATVDGNTTSYNAIGLNPYTAYVFKIEAVDVSNNVSTTTLTAKVNVFDTAAPTWSASSSVKASKITENSLTLTWNGASDNVSVESYKIYKDGTVIGTVDGNTTSYDVTGLNQNTEYTFKVEAVDGGDNSSTTGPSAKVKTVEKVITDSSTGITVKGNIPAGAAKISVNAIKDPSKIAELDKSLSSATTKTETYKTAAAYDLSLLDSSNAKIQPNGTVTISIPLDAGIANKKLAVFYVDDKGAATEMPSTVANGAITFTTTHFSQYVIAEVVPVTPADTTTNSGNGNGGNTTPSDNNGGTTGTPAGGNTTGTTNSGTTNTDNGTAATNTNAAGSTGTTTTSSTASGTGSTASTNSTSTDGNVANPKTGNSVKSILPIFIAAIIAMAGLVLVEIRRRKRLN